MDNELLGLVLQEGYENLAAHLGHEIHKIVESVIVEEGKMALENHSIKATKNAYNGSGEFVENTTREFHGVLLSSV